MNTALSCALNSWQPTIGDPSVWGWLTVLVYSLAACLSLRVAVRAPFPDISRKRERVFWIFLGLILVALAINKQLDLQSFVTAIGRCLAKLQGWYETRRIVQMGFLLGILIVFVGMLAILARLLIGTWRRTAFPALGLVFVLGFVMMRAVGFHGFDQLLRIPIFSASANVMLEWSGPLLIILSALILVIRFRDRS